MFVCCSSLVLSFVLSLVVCVRRCFHFVLFDVVFRYRGCEHAARLCCWDDVLALFCVVLLRITFIALHYDALLHLLYFCIVFGRGSREACVRQSVIGGALRRFALDVCC